ncbi:unnamed protein product [Clavelina lepadiformis]|uniref:EF-hand domain-containing protein n=1 Tax=Clavelina lepadiformis TaxID=159417 RepID=A0ABP0GXG4_CLALP
MPETSRHKKELIDKSKRRLLTATDPVEKLRLLCLARGSCGIKNLIRSFKFLDDDQNSLNFLQFKTGLRAFRLHLELKEIKEIFEIFDKDKSGFINFEEFIVKLRPQLSYLRRSLIQRAFRKLDKTGDGLLTVENLRDVYDVKHHPKYMNGEWSEAQVFCKFLETFDSSVRPDGVVTYEEFYNYYAGVSASIDNDAYFDVMMRKAWKL